MIPQFEKLTKEEIEFLLKAPVLVSVFAANINHKISKIAKADAIKLSHLKTFTAVPLLRPYYKEVEKNFNKNFAIIEENYVPFDEGKIHALKKELNNLYAVISRLDEEYAATLRWSLAKYTDHVKKSEHVFVDNFLFPFFNTWIHRKLLVNNNCMITIMNDLPENVLGAAATGKVTDEDYVFTLIPAVEEKLKAHKKVRLFYHLGSDFTGFELTAVLDDAKMGIKHLASWDRIALVSDHHMINALARFFGHIFPCPVRVYKDAEFEDAKKWITGK